MQLAAISQRKCRELILGLHGLQNNTVCLSQENAISGYKLEDLQQWVDRRLT